MMKKLFSRIGLAALLMMLLVIVSCGQAPGSESLEARIHTSGGYTLENLGRWFMSFEEICKKRGYAEDDFTLVQWHYDIVRPLKAEKYMSDFTVSFDGISKEARIVLAVQNDGLIYGRYAFECGSKEEMITVYGEILDEIQDWPFHDHIRDKEDQKADIDGVRKELERGYFMMIHWRHEDNSLLKIDVDPFQENMIYIMTYCPTYPMANLR